MEGAYVKPTLLLTGAGLAAALFIVVLPLALYVAGALFGAAIAISLQKLRVFSQPQAGWFIAVSTLAYYVSLALVLKLGVFNPNADSHSLAPLIIAGCVGGLFVVGGALFLVRPKVVGLAVLILACSGAVCGALLAAAGSALGPSLGQALSKVLYNLPPGFAPSSPSSNLQDRYTLQSLYALFIVWDAGMGLVLGLMLGGRQCAAKETEQ